MAVANRQIKLRLMLVIVSVLAFALGAAVAPSSKWPTPAADQLIWGLLAFASAVTLPRTISLRNTFK